MARLLLYHLLAQTIIYGLIGVTALIAPPTVRTAFASIFKQIYNSPLLLTILLLFILVPWISWLLIRKGDIWLGISLGLLITFLPGITGIKMLTGMIELLSIAALPRILPQLIMGVFISGLFIHYSILVFYHWAKSTRTSH